MEQDILIKLVAEQAAKVGAEVAIATLDKERKKDRRDMVDRRLRNTKLLLKNYRLFRAHADNAVYEIEESITPMQILEDLMMPGRDSSMIVESVKNSVARTVTLVRHIETMLKLYQAYCYMSGSEIEERRWRVIEALYITEPASTIPDLSKAEGVVDRVIYNDIDAASERIAALMFGVDGIKLKEG